MKVKIRGKEIYNYVHAICTHMTESSGYECPELEVHEKDFPIWFTLDAEPLEPCFEHKSWKTLCAKCDPDYPGDNKLEEKIINIIN